MNMLASDACNIKCKLNLILDDSRFLAWCPKPGFACITARLVKIKTKQTKEIVKLS